MAALNRRMPRLSFQVALYKFVITITTKLSRKDVVINYSMLNWPVAKNQLILAWYRFSDY